jgi:carboxylesterase type B
MKHFTALLIAAALISRVQAQTTPTKSDIPYVENGHERQVLDIYAPPNAKDLPVVFWIHGGGWQAGDKSDVSSSRNGSWTEVSFSSPPTTGCCPTWTWARSFAMWRNHFGWVQKHIAEYGGNPKRVLVGGTFGGRAACGHHLH